MTFKAGDKVVRINHGYGSVKAGDIVEVSRVWPEQGSLSIRGDTRTTYDINQFVLAKLVPPTKDTMPKKPSSNSGRSRCAIKRCSHASKSVAAESVSSTPTSKAAKRRAQSTSRARGAAWGSLGSGASLI